MNLKLLTCLLALCYIRGSEGVGCENNPCEHFCTDTIDSYFCTCWPNYDLQDDGLTCKNQKRAAIDQLYLGCFEDDPEEKPDFSFKIWTRADATVGECIRSCSARAFLYAGLQNGADCWCDNKYQRRYNETTGCTTACGGTPTEICGGTNAMSVYRVTMDDKYMGCWFEDASAREMDVLMWDKSTEQSPRVCVDSCSMAGYTYAAMFNGGDCYCGNAYGSYGPAMEEWCTVPCIKGYSLENCGGNSTNAIYRVVKSENIAIPYGPETFGTIYVGEYLFDYPNQQGYIGNRIITYSSASINIPSEDTTCWEANCYDLCGTIATPQGYDTLMQTEMTIRDWHIKLSEVMPKYIEGKSYVPQIVRIFAQTFVMDGSVNFPFSVYIRARQIIINHAVNPSITFNHEGPIIGVNVTKAVFDGPPSDLAFQKMSMLCARMLLGTTDEFNNQLAYNMIDDVVKDRAYSEEQQHYMDSVRAIRSNMTSIGRNNLHWVPYYSKNYYTSVLSLFLAEVEHYADEYEALLDSYEECEVYKAHASALLSIWVSTVLTRSDILREDAEDALKISEETYKLMHVEYNESRAELEVAAEEFEKGLEDWKKQKTRKAMFHMISSTVRLAFGIPPVRSGGLRGEIEDVMGVVAALELLEVTMENLGQTVYELDQYLLIVDEIMATQDYERYMDNVESVAQLYPMIVEWENFKYQIDVIFREPEFRNIDGAIEFSFAVIDLCNWGQALTKSATEYANMIREYVKFDAIHKANQEMAERYDEYFQQVGENCEQKGRLALAFYEQNYDMMLIANDLLIQFCESYFYELLDVCPDGARPSFDADLRQLSVQIERALFEANDYQRRSSANIQIDIVDPVDTLPNCSDSTVCPVKVFRETGRFIYSMPLDERRLDGIDLFLISELFIQFPGASTTDQTKTDFRLEVSKEGPFINRLRGDAYEFYTRGLTSMTYQYDIITHATELSCNLVEEGGSSGYMIQQAAPFTTWHIKIDSYSADYIDVSNVNTVNFTLAGSYLNTRLDGQSLIM